MPEISVVVPAYQAEQCLENCVTSILAQTFRDLK
ncbi:MAG: glycosyltransferase [Schwartzia sp.]|nr:glycosyltransferase [Schwartzia sp. (in: firmicutes)]